MSLSGGGLFSFMEELYDVVVVEVPGGEGGLVPGPRVLVAWDGHGLRLPRVDQDEVYVRAARDDLEAELDEAGSQTLRVGHGDAAHGVAMGFALQPGEHGHIGGELAVRLHISETETQKAAKTLKT